MGSENENDWPMVVQLESGEAGPRLQRRACSSISNPRAPLQPTLRKEPHPSRTEAGESCLMRPQVWGKEAVQQLRSPDSCSGCRRWGGPGSSGGRSHYTQHPEIQLPGVSTALLDAACMSRRGGLMAAKWTEPSGPHRAGPPHPWTRSPGLRAPSGHSSGSTAH